jgi:hypothetical protein
MAGEGCAFLHAPAGFAARPPVTGWFAEFEDLTLAPGRVGYAKDASRFMGATFDPSALYRFNAVQRMLQNNGLTTARISEHVAQLQSQFLEAIGGTAFEGAELLNPLDAGPHARFLAFRSPNAQGWYAALLQRNCITDVRRDVLRVGFGIYHEHSDVAKRPVQRHERMIAVDHHPWPVGPAKPGERVDLVKHSSATEQQLANENQVVPALGRRVEESFGQAVERLGGDPVERNPSCFRPARELAARAVELAVGG